MNKYFISFAHNLGFGNTIMVTDKNLENEMKSGKMQEIHESIKKQTGLSNVAILYFKKL